MKMKVSNYIAQKLVKQGISQVFTVTGGGAMHLNDALGHQEGLHCLYQHHEQACAMAAEAYARIHNQIAAVCVTTGPGGTNAITGVVGGWLDSIPMLILSGQVRYDTTARWSGVGIRAMGDQEFDITKAIDCMTKYSEMVTDPLRIRYCLEKAIYLAYSGRPGPTWLDIPVDIQGTLVETDELEGFDPEIWEAENPKPVPKVSEETIGIILERIRASKRPVLNAGNGIRIAGAYPGFERVIKKLGIPVVTGWNSQDCMCDDDPLYAGRAGGMGDRPGNFAVQNSDLLFSIGSRLSIRQVGYNYQTWAREAYTIINDIDIEELKKPSVHVDLPIHADAKDLLEALDLALEETPLFGGGEGLPGMTWLSTCRMWREEYPVVLPRHLEQREDRNINVYALVKELSAHLSENQISVMGNGSACVVGGHAYQIKKGQRFISNSAIASMGYDLPAAIGACMADHSRDIILLTGDGSIQMNIQELQTIIHHQLPIKIFLINNGGYHSIRQTQKNFFGEPLVGIGVDSHDLSFPQMEKLAAAYGYPYISAAHHAELAEAIEKTLAMEGPVICEFFVTMDQNFEPKSAAKRLDDGSFVSPPLEDLSPFLPEEELDRNMIISK
ncbi:MAG: thiamine pyrophosphate-binding protein [Hungatella sp.]